VSAYVIVHVTTTDILLLLTLPLPFIPTFAASKKNFRILPLRFPPLYLVALPPLLHGPPNMSLSFVLSFFPSPRILSSDLFAVLLPSFLLFFFLCVLASVLHLQIPLSVIQHKLQVLLLLS
jgi:hypothetical protein